MNKIIKVFIVSILFCTFGCGKEKYDVCTINIDNSADGYSLNSTYKIYYNKTFVTKIEKEENYKSNDENTIDYLEKSIDLNYSNLKDLYGGYDYNIKSDKNSIDITTIIDMNEFDVKKMVSNGDLSSDYVVSNKLTVSGIKHFYKEKGAICDI